MRVEELQGLAESLREPLTGLSFERMDLTRDIGSGSSFPASADVPGGLLDGDRFYRTDLDFACFYDAGNTQWLTAQEWVCEVTYSTDLTVTYAATTGSVRRGNVRSSHVPYFTRAQVVTTLAAGTSNGSNFWTVALIATAGAGTTIWSFTTAADAAAATTIHATNTMSAQSGSAETIIRMDLTKTLNPPNISPVVAALFYRLVIP